MGYPKYIPALQSVWCTPSPKTYMPPSALPAQSCDIWLQGRQNLQAGLIYFQVNSFPGLNMATIGKQKQSKNRVHRKQKKVKLMQTAWREEGKEGLLFGQLRCTCWVQSAFVPSWRTRVRTFVPRSTNQALPPLAAHDWAIETLSLGSLH